MTPPTQPPGRQASVDQAPDTAAPAAPGGRLLLPGSAPDELAGDPTLRVFAYAVAEKAWLYVPVVDALMAAKERFTPASR